MTLMVFISIYMIYPASPFLNPRNKMMGKSIDHSEIMMVTILFLLPLLLLIIILKKVTKSRSAAVPLPPGPYSWPIISTINHFIHPFTPTSLSHLAQSYGPLFHLTLGTQHLVVGSSPPAAAAILKDNDRAQSGRSVPHAVPLTPSQIEKLSFWADPTSHHWRNIRAVCRAELFSAAALEAQAGRRDEKAAEMVERLRSREGAATDVGMVVYATVVNIFGNALFSKDVFGLDDEFACEEFRGFLRGIIGAISTPNLADFYPFLKVLDVQGLRKKHREFSIKIREIWKSIVEERRRDHMSELRHDNDDFLDSLISRGFGDDQINQTLEDLFSAGVDTTASTINRTMAELISTPESLTKLKHELDDAFDGQDSYAVENLPYLQACIKETLRLHPPAPLLLSHRAGETCRVMGYTIPKDARILVNVWAIGRDPTVWEEPLEYRPERFLNSSVDFKGNDFEFLPFSAGRRICPGLPMATKIIPLIVASLVYFFDWSCPGQVGRVDETFRATSQMRGPLLLRPKARK